MTIEELKNITEARMESAKVLMGAEDWFWAANTMATALECSLKAMICKTLGLSVYPEDRKKEQIIKFFWTHEFDRLLVLSGLNSVFSPTAGEPEKVQQWSDFTKQFTGDWANMKYEYDRQLQFDKEKVQRLYNNLINPSYGVITIIKQKW